MQEQTVICPTDKEQQRVEQSITKLFGEILQLQSKTDNQQTEFGFLQKELHAQYLYRSLNNFGRNIYYYDSGHPWVIYWIIHGLELLNHPQCNIDSLILQSRIIKMLAYCQDKNGGFCGGHRQFPQLASTYAAVLSLLIIGTEEAYLSINRQGMYNFLKSLKNKNGSFRMAEKGEVDMRGIYIAVIVSEILNIQTAELMENVVDFISSCQTYEGGIGPDIYSEAHGGLTFCGFAALCSLKQVNKINLSKLLQWTVNRQMKIEGGFQGRTNKLVDACYSFWQGATFQLINDATGGKAQCNNQLLMNQISLQIYILLCQNLESGGLFDKPGKPIDIYHTCYSLSGLSVAQFSGDEKSKTLYKDIQQNELNRIDPIFNVGVDKVKKAREYFKKLPPLDQNLLDKPLIVQLPQEQPPLEQLQQNEQLPKEKK